MKIKTYLLLCDYSFPFLRTSYQKRLDIILIPDNRYNICVLTVICNSMFKPVLSAVILTSVPTASTDMLARCYLKYVSRQRRTQTQIQCVQMTHTVAPIESAERKEPTHTHAHSHSEYMEVLFGLQI